MGIIEKYMASGERKRRDKEIEKWMKGVFEKVEEVVLKNEKVKSRCCCGSTATILIKFCLPLRSGGGMEVEGEMRGFVVGHIGDTRAVAVVEEGGDAGSGEMRRRYRCVALTNDHTPLNEKEANRVRAQGGCVLKGRVNAVLGVSRALGDTRFKPYVSSVPDVVLCEQTKGLRAVILASDGLWDFVDYKQVAEIVRKDDLRGVGDYMEEEPKSRRFVVENCVAKKIGELAVKNGSTDDVSVVVVRDKTWR